MSYYRRPAQRRQQQKFNKNAENSNMLPSEHGSDQSCRQQQNNQRGGGMKNNDNTNNNNDKTKSNNNEQHDELNDSTSKDDCVYLTDRERLPLIEIGNKFLNGKEHELVLSNLSTNHRKFMHRFAARNGLKSRSTGCSSKRVLHLTRRRPANPILSNAVHLTISPESESVLDINIMKNHLMRFEDGEAGLGEAAAATVKHNPHFDEHDIFGYCLVPPASRFAGKINPFKGEKMLLPMYQYRQKFLSLLSEHSVIIVSGETGSGKTTQTPQYILEEYNINKKPCHIVVTQPRRIAAISTATRIAEERGERCGETCGYQVRLKSATSKSTCLMFTTSGSFLRAIMCRGPEFFNTITHVIIDEIHERDKDTDLALISIKNELKVNKNLRIILMSATMDINLLSAYFDNCPVITVPGQSYQTNTFYLDDVLWNSGYETSLMAKYMKFGGNTNQLLASIQSIGETVENQELRGTVDTTIMGVFDPNFDSACLDPLYQLEYYIRNEGVPINYVSTNSGITPLMVACKLNNVEFVSNFLKYGANINICDVYGRRAFDYAKQNVPDLCSQLVERAVNVDEIQKQIRLDAYLRSFNNDQEVDHDLIFSLIESLFRNESQEDGTIMVFLPGYADILQQRDLITKTLPHGSFSLYILHGNMSTDDQTRVLLPSSLRKIILSTNIGQTSITIPDLVYVIDSGKIKIKQYDSMTESTQLQVDWISKADASQRAGRAGRIKDGICYRLYSKDKFASMLDYSIPEFLRIPLAEICLYAKTLRPNLSVSEYLSEALNQPSLVSIEQAIVKLKILNIFTDNECVTPLGKCIADLPIDVQLGKCLIYSIFLRCFQSVLTIVAYHSVKEPFVLPSDRQLQGKASYLRKSFSEKSFSDHVGILNLYEKYLESRKSSKKCKDFCEKHFLSQPCMEQFIASRTHLLDVTSRYFIASKSSNEFNNDMRMVRYAITAGLYPNLGYINRPMTQIRSGDERHIIVQRSSCINPPGMKSLKDYIHSLPYDWILYYEKSRFNPNAVAINTNTIISPLMVILQCGKSLKIDYIKEDDEDDDPHAEDEMIENDMDKGNGDGDNDNGNADVDAFLEGAACLELCNAAAALTLSGSSVSVIAIITIDNWIKFTCSEKHGNQLLKLRSLIENEFNAFVVQKELNNNNEAAITILQKLLALNFNVE